MWTACVTSIEKGSMDRDLRARAYEIAQKAILVDTHIDVPYRLHEKWEDVSQRTETGDFDYPRAKAGGLKVAFMSIYVPADHEDKGNAKAFAERMIGYVERLVREHPDKFAIVTSVAEVRRRYAEGRILLALGMENGAPIEGKLENLRYFYDRGIRYITLAHSKSNHICDSSYDSNRPWRGLSPFGRQVVAEMNRLGIMVDVSHISDEAFDQVLEITRAPVIASHSSCRAFTPGWERNLSDDMIRRLAANGGVVQVNFGSAFVNDEYRRRSEAARREIQAYLQAHGLSFQDPAAQAYIRQYQQEHPIPYADISDVVRCIDHIVQLVGVDHVGLGSDFDGVGDSLPTGLKDVSMYPNLVYELLRRGYSEAAIRKILGENLLRVWERVEQVARDYGKSDEVTK
jgi:membrane dipeptidase